MIKDNKIDFFLVGSARCGTTTLYNYLKKHNDIFLPKVKEPNYFSNVESPKKEDYALPKPNEEYHAKIIKSEKVYTSLYKEAKKNQLKGDTSPSYIWDKRTAERIYKHNPNAKILISLRNPVDRAYSHYIMNYYTGVDGNKSFQEALKADKNDVWGSCNCYLEMSSYFNQVKTYFDIFPRDQIMVLVYEDWIVKIQESINTVFNYLQVEPLQVEINKIEQNKISPLKNLRLLNLLRHNRVKQSIKHLINQERIDALKAFFFNDEGEIAKIDEDLRNELKPYFNKDIELLSQLTGIDFVEKWQ